jgi:lactobin A/cerein 7B family class IIb bacteriocin
MENLKELSSKELLNVNGGFVWVPIAIKAGKAIATGAGSYLAVTGAIDAGSEIIEGYKSCRN